jgi:poly(A)-specific ribonuclease
LQQEYQQAIGFRRVIDVISRERKPLIGHNMFLDILHIHHRFLAPLPASCDEFKHNIHKAFPWYCIIEIITAFAVHPLIGASRHTHTHLFVIHSILDTKYFSSKCASFSQFDSTAVGDLYKALDKPPWNSVASAPAADFTRYSQDSELLHEAGFDAYCTGVIYARLAKVHAEKIGTDQRVLPCNPVVAAYANRLFMARSASSFCIVEDDGMCGGSWLADWLLDGSVHLLTVSCCANMALITTT